MPEQGERYGWALMLGITLFVIGFILVFLGSFISAGTNVSTGGIIVIGPIPILLGSGPYGQILVFISTLIAIFMIVLYFILTLEIKKVAK